MPKPKINPRKAKTFKSPVPNNLETVRIHFNVYSMQTISLVVNKSKTLSENINIQISHKTHESNWTEQILFIRTKRFTKVSKEMASWAEVRL